MHMTYHQTFRSSLPGHIGPGNIDHVKTTGHLWDHILLLVGTAAYKGPSKHNGVIYVLITKLVFLIPGEMYVPPKYNRLLSLSYVMAIILLSQIVAWVKVTLKADVAAAQLT